MNISNIFKSIHFFFTCQNCNICNQLTPRSKCIIDNGYDNWGYQCIACATDSGLLKRTKEIERAQQKMLDRRKEFGL